MTVRPWIRCVSLLAVGLAVAGVPGLSLAEDPAGRLLDRVPAGASMALVIEELPEQIERISASPLARGVMALGPVQAWFESDEGATMRRARRDVEAAMGVSMTQFVEGLLGDAVVLSLHLPADEPPDAARGLLQTVVTDRDLLERFIGVANGAELASGKLRGVEDRAYRGIAYSVRTFRDGRPEESYAVLDDDTFVWTNREQLLRAVIDREAGGAMPRSTAPSALDRVRDHLPDRAMVSMFIDPEFVARLIRANPDDASLDGLPEPVAQAFSAVESLGVALEWREGPVVHLVEVLDADRLPDPVRSWASRSGGGSELMARIPDAAMLAVAGQVDGPALHDLVIASVPGEDQGRVGTVLELFRGLLLGRDLREEILPAMGPGVVGWIHPPKADQAIRHAPAVLVASIADPDAAGAVENALRTVLAFVSLDEDRKPPMRMEDQWREGVRISGLIAGDEGGSPRFAFAVARGLIVLGTDFDAVASALADGSAGGSDRRPTSALAARDRLFPEASTFAYLDLAALHRIALERRDDLEAFMMARAGQDQEDAPTREDLELLFELLPLFRGVYATSSISTDATIAHQRIGLIVAE
ncbi:hypothetical protein AB1L88_00860 [Tautonia sp. JC769]|uniref:hypothetical protein n=1 Tax=Tautonia sp. JC769 TaxID=3232135 RepID=UPI00345A4FC2